MDLSAGPMPKGNHILSVGAPQGVGNQSGAMNSVGWMRNRVARYDSLYASGGDSRFGTGGKNCVHDYGFDPSNTLRPQGAGGLGYRRPAAGDVVDDHGAAACRELR